MRGWQVRDAVKGGDVDICGAKVYVVADWCVVVLCAGVEVVVESGVWVVTCW